MKTLNRFMNYTFDTIVEGSGKRLKIGDLPEKVVSSVQLQKHCKRKFPGPAGNLPPSPLPDIEHVDVLHDDESNKKLMIKDELYSPHTTVTDDIFTSNIWMSLLADLGPDEKTILENFSIRSSLLKASKKLLHKGKIPLIAGYVENVHEQGSDISFVIRDQTGKMKGSLHHEIMKESKTSFQAGSVVILRHVSVISPSSRTHYLNVTPGNILLVYTSDTNKGVVKQSFLKKQTATTADGIPSLNDVIKESHLELMTSLQIFKENLTKKSSSSLHSYLNVSKGFLSSPVGLSNQHGTPVLPMSAESRKIGFTKSMPHTFVNETMKSSRNNSCFQRPLTNNEKLAHPLFSSSVLNENLKLVTDVGIIKPSASFSCNNTRLPSTDVNASSKKEKLSENLPIQWPQTDVSDIEDSLFLLKDDDDDVLQMCDVVDRTEHNSASPFPTARLFTDSKEMSPGQQFDKTSWDYNEIHPTLLGKQNFDRPTNSSSLQFSAINGSNLVMDLHKSSADSSVADSGKVTVSADLGRMSTDVERDTRIQLVHPGPSLIVSNELFPHWDDDFNTDVLLSQLSEDF
ncbi:hypothetical protein Btru_054961 [Bulinus truncatus]|nr:hypothetical protein Btru_054961 [Bulinus truncatus]